MADLSIKRIEFAAEMFLTEMRRQAVMLGIRADIKPLKDYPPAQRSALMAGVQRSLRSADPASDMVFSSWAGSQTAG